ncbi:DUF4157 domain-containing protein [Streptomyces sp. NPDC058195]|uniref:DUF4157 domain-containing protein n=1 Tax=Streptomyces sp. NPDC058195 TaxID=3346375 RepID=UPI0036E098E6
MRDYENAGKTGTEGTRRAARGSEAASPAPLPGLLPAQAEMGNAAVVQMLRQAGYHWAEETHQHSDGCGQDQAGQPSVQRSAVHDVLRTLGRPLDSGTRVEMEARLGADFSDVRIHNDSAARASAAEVGARAYTSGSHVVVGEGGADKHTLAHELTHVLQQRQGAVAGTDNGAGLRVSDPSDRFEREAETNARQVMRGPVPQGGPSGADAPPAQGGGAAAPSLPVQRVFQGELNGYGTAEVMKALKERIPGARPKWSEVDAARNAPTVYGDLGAVASALGLQLPSQQAGAAQAPEATAAPVAPTPAAPVPSKRPTPPPKPARFSGGGGQQSSSATAPQVMVPSVQAPAPAPTVPATVPSAPVEERREQQEQQVRQEPQVRQEAVPPVPAEEPVERMEGVAEEVSLEDFKANTAQARAAWENELREPGKYLRRRAASPWNDALFEQLAKSVTIRNRTTLPRLLIDQLYSCLEWTGRAPITVFTHEAQGKGDLMLGVKTADALRETFPRTEENKNDIALLTAAGAYKKQPGVFKESGHPFTVLPGTTAEAPEIDSGKAPAHVIVAPQLAVTRPFQRTVGRWDSKVSAMTEYSKKEDNSHTTGLGDEEVGITFDAGLRAYKQQQDGIADEGERRTARLDHLQVLKSKDLLTALFPPEQEQTAEGFARSASSRLYFAYSNKSAMRFARTVAEVEYDQGNDVHVVQSSPHGMPELDDTVKRELAGLGVAGVRLVKVTSGEEAPEITSIATGGTGKTMHWITTDRMPHDDMLTLIKASEPIVMTTGNQSTSEALSAGKTLMYESIGMPQSQAFRQSLYKGAKVSDRDIESIAAISADYDKTGDAPGQPQFKAAAAALRTMEQENKMGDFSDRASATKDLGRWVGGQQLREFLMKSTFGPELRTKEDEIIKKPREAASYRDFVAYLSGLPGKKQ